jgi:hypothetical protein
MRATFVLSTGRCGTQSLTKAISQSLNGRAVITHEPIRAQYKPRLTLQPFNPARKSSLSEANTHFRQVVATVTNGTEYVETGWPAFTWFENFRKELGERWRYVHLVRNPVHVAASFVTHGYYQKGRTDDFPDLAILQPTDAGVKYPEIASEWRKLSVFDKCLYQWLEINAWGGVLAARNITPAAVVRFEDLFSAQSVRDSLFDVLDWPRPSAPMAHFDAFHFETALPLKPTSSVLWAKVKDLAATLGYEAALLDESVEKLHYNKPRIAGRTFETPFGKPANRTS